MNMLDDFEFSLLWMAIRYAMNRQTISSSTLPEKIIQHWYHRMSDDQKDRIVTDLERNLIEYGGDAFGHRTIDRPTWLRFMACLDYKKHREITLIDDSIITVFYANGMTYPLKEYIARPRSEITVPEESIKSE